MKKKIYTAKEFYKLLYANGYALVRQNGGSHFIFRHLGTGRTISVNKNLNRMVAQRLIKENNLLEEV